MSDLSVADKINIKNAHRELVFERQSDGTKNVSLMVKDESVDRSQKGYYKIRFRPKLYFQSKTNFDARSNHTRTTFLGRNFS